MGSTVTATGEKERYYYVLREIRSEEVRSAMEFLELGRIKDAVFRREIAGFLNRRIGKNEVEKRWKNEA